jgi:hypothetical protein
MEVFRQGGGIIDINTCLGVAPRYKLIGLFCSLSFILVEMTNIYARTGVLIHSDFDLALFGRSLIDCIVATPAMMGSRSSNLGPDKMFYVLADLATAHARLTASLPRHPALFVAHNTLQD